MAIPVGQYEQTFPTGTRKCKYLTLQGSKIFLMHLCLVVRINIAAVRIWQLQYTPSTKMVSGGKKYSRHLNQDPGVAKAQHLHPQVAN